MPGCHGGDQLDEEYAPYLYYKGKRVGEKKAKELRDRDEKFRREKIRSLLDRLGLKDFDYEENGYAITDGAPWKITKEGFELGIIHNERYIKINYEIGLSPHEPTILRQVEIAGELATQLRGYGCNQLIELPPRNVVIPKLQEIIKYSKQVIRKFKNM